MARDIRYTRTSDGVSIAYAVSGNGPAIIQMPFLPYATLDSETTETPQRAELAASATLIEFDARGFGLSDHGEFRYSIETLRLDLDAVVRSLGLQKLALVASLQGALVAIHYAANNPDLVDKLALIGPIARGPHFWDQGRTQAFRALREADWETYKDVVHRSYGTIPFGLGIFAEVDFKGISAEAVGAVMDGLVDADVTPELERVQCRTLVIHLEAGGFIPIGVAREIASKIPNARLSVYSGDPEERALVVSVVAEFLGIHLSVATPSAPMTQAPGEFRTIMFTDLEGSTSLTQRLGDLRAQDVIRAHDDVVRSALSASGGREIKHTGDGIMAAFDTASRAIECAIAIQRETKAISLAARVRIGINAGEPVAQGDDLFGTAVQLARRICDQGDGGDILVANVVRELAAGKGFAFADRGDTVLKGFEDATRIYAVSWSD